LYHAPLGIRHPALPLAQLLLSSLSTYKIGFPGWPDPNLDSVPVFWGVSSKKGACTSPLFHLGGWPTGKSVFPRVCRRSGFATRARSNRALSFLIRPLPVTVGARHAVPAPARISRSHLYSGPSLHLMRRACITQSSAGPGGNSGLSANSSPQENERPVGGPAARAWGMEGLVT